MINLCHFKGNDLKIISHSNENLWRIQCFNTVYAFPEYVIVNVYVLVRAVAS